MRLVYSKNHIPIRISSERLNHIYTNHPEMQGEDDNIVLTIENPDLILQGDFDELLSVKLFDKTPISENKYLIAVYKEMNSHDGFLITAYFTRQYSQRRKILWKC